MYRTWSLLAPLSSSSRLPNTEAQGIFLWAMTFTDLAKTGFASHDAPRPQPIAGENNGVRSLGIENLCKEGRGEVLRDLAWGDNGVATSASRDREV